MLLWNKRENNYIQILFEELVIIKRNMKGPNKEDNLKLMAESIMDCQQCSKDLRRQGFVETYALGSDLEGDLELEGMFCVGCFSKMPDWSRIQYRYCSPTGDFLSRGWSFTTELHLMECIERYF